MRHRGLILLIGVAVAGCSSGLLEQSTSPPTGLFVNIDPTFSAGIVPTTGAIFGKGDSVVATVTRPATCGKTLSGEAGLTPVGALVMTVVLTAEGIENCTPLNGMTTYRLSVHSLPAGARDVSVHVRLVNNGANSDTTVVQKTVVLP